MSQRPAAERETFRPIFAGRGAGTGLVRREYRWTGHEWRYWDGREWRLARSAVKEIPR
jgi:hypothetical protein